MNDGFRELTTSTASEEGPPRQLPVRAELLPRDDASGDVREALVRRTWQPGQEATLELALELYRSIQNASLWVVPNGGHGPIFGDQAPPFRRISAEFLRS